MHMVHPTLPLLLSVWGSHSKQFFPRTISIILLFEWPVQYFYIYWHQLGVTPPLISGREASVRDMPSTDSLDIIQSWFMWHLIPLITAVFVVQLHSPCIGVVKSNSCRVCRCRSWRCWHQIAERRHWSWSPSFAFLLFFPPRVFCCCANGEILTPSRIVVRVVKETCLDYMAEESCGWCQACCGTWELDTVLGPWIRL